MTISTNEKHLYKNQPGMVLKTYAKSGKGSELFDLCMNLHYNEDPDGPIDWILCQPIDEPDTMWAFEFYKDDESFKRHYSDPAMDKGHQKVFDLCDTNMDKGIRKEIHIEYSNNTKEDLNRTSNPLYKNQPGVILKMKAKPGKAKELFELTNDMHYTDDIDGPIDWVLCRADDDEDVLWAFEFYKDEDSFIRHYNDATLDKGHNDVMELLAEMPMRIDVHIAHSNYTLSK